MNVCANNIILNVITLRTAQEVQNYFLMKKNQRADCAAVGTLTISWVCDD